MKINLYFFLLFIFVIVHTECLKNCKPRIAIIGGGIGGASASHFLGELSHNNVKIDLYEADTLGGRLSTVEMNKNEYESGGSIIHSQNKYMQDFVNLLGLEHRSNSKEISGIWDGAEFVFEESNWKIISLAKLFYRYGLDLIKIERYISSILSDFEKIYDLQDSGKFFQNVTALLSAMNPDFPMLLKVSGNSHFSNLGYSKTFIDEIMKSAMVVNYGQDVNIHSFVTCVSLAAVTGNLWSVKGGNKKVPEHLIYRNANVNVIPSRVNKIINIPGKENQNEYELLYTNEGNEIEMKSVYDVVILATPLTRDHKYPIIFEGFSRRDFAIPGGYHTTIATFVKAKLRLSYFGLEDKIDSILSCDPNITIISSVGRLETVEGPNESDDRVWKIFSNAPLGDDLLEKMFSNIDEVQEIVWKAYPEYSTDERHDQFKLHDGLYHVNAIEWAASAMEMSAIGGRNVAILVYNDFLQRCEEPKQESSTTPTASKDSSEL